MISKPLVLTIAISTVKGDFDGVLEYIVRVSNRLPRRVGFVIVSQLEDVDRCYNETDSVKVVFSTQKGLSRSRNLAFDNCRATWVWFQDGDICLIESRIEALINFLESSQFDIVLCQVGSLENKAENFKDYSRYSVSPTLLSFRISSIEIIARSAFLKNNKIKFDENLGLGTQLPSCEENLFFYDAVVRNRARYGRYATNVCLHTTMPENRSIDYKRRYKARGYLLGRMRSIISPLVLAWWTIRNTGDGVSRVSRFSLMLQGYLRCIRRLQN